MWNRSKTESFTGLALSYNFDCHRLFLRQIKEKQQSMYLQQTDALYNWGLNANIALMTKHVFKNSMYHWKWIYKVWILYPVFLFENEYLSDFFSLVAT